MRARERASLEKALRILRDPGGDGKTRVSHGFTNEVMKCVRCHLPTADQRPGIAVPPPPHCTCGTGVP